MHNALNANEAFFRKVSFDVLARGCTVTVGPMSLIENTMIRTRGKGHQLCIGQEVRIKAGRFWFEDENCKIEIGDETTIEDGHIAVTEPGSIIRVGRDCMLAFDVDIRNGDSHAIRDAATGERINLAKDITIGVHVWLGAHSQILKGVTIGDGAIVGVRSVVTKDVPIGVVACGVPARVVREGVAWGRERPA